MKTNTRSQIQVFLHAKGPARPVELVRKFGISPQALHRHLRTLVATGLLEKRGCGPHTRYAIAGAPFLDNVRRWYSPFAEPAVNPDPFVCPTRDVFTARLRGLASLTRFGMKEDDLPLAISTAGAVGNNSFDHNLGAWRDVSGCWFETQTTGGRFWMCIADRGQGVFRSLTRADPAIPDEQAALVAAFERTLSGRAPENRGNGLKFVRNIIVAGDKRGLACRSGTGLVDYGRLGEECRAELARFPSQTGTITLMLWRLK
jgi:DNA-binding transcriptional ArsR family regulator